MQLQPYIFFWGRCQEALDFYKSIFGGDYKIDTMEGAELEAHDPAWTGGVMHASFVAPGVAFMASDGRERKPVDPDAGNICLSIDAGSSADGARIAAALGEGGKEVMPYGDAPWGDGKFGVVQDRFGTEWMIVAED